MRKIRVFVCYQREDDARWFKEDNLRPWLGKGTTLFEPTEATHGDD